jgi:predicted RNA-binding Zn-ribbon protein involved in translation (DUF1610 family)
MTPTDKLHRELDKRGIRWFASRRGSTIFTSPVLGNVAVWENAFDGLVLDVGYVSMTPEQVIAATLGKTCRNTSKWANVFKCSECGFEYDFITDPYQGPHYCPSCGARIEAGDE